MGEAEEEAGALVVDVPEMHDVEVEVPSGGGEAREESTGCVEECTGPPRRGAEGQDQVVAPTPGRGTESETGVRLATEATGTETGKAAAAMAAALGTNGGTNANQSAALVASTEAGVEAPLATIGSPMPQLMPLSGPSLNLQRLQPIAAGTSQQDLEVDSTQQVWMHFHFYLLCMAGPEVALQNKPHVSIAPHVPFRCTTTFRLAEAERENSASLSWLSPF